MVDSTLPPAPSRSQVKLADLDVDHRDQLH